MVNKQVEMVEGLQILCKFCSSALYEKPTLELVNNLAEQSALFQEEPFASIAPDSGKALSTLFGSLDIPEKRDALTTELQQDYTYLFYMVGVSHTSPYESVYRTDDRTLFGPTTLEVRKAYREAGVELLSRNHEPDDHVGLEFAFLAHLLASISEALSQGNKGQIPTIEAQMQSFLNDHILVFSDTYFTNLADRAQSLYYRLIADIAQKTLAQLSQEHDWYSQAVSCG